MGVTFDAARLLRVLRDSGVDFDRTLTLGRQSLLLRGDQVAELQDVFGLTDAQALDAPYCEPFLREVCGATTVESLDASDYESASRIADLNKRLPDSDEQTWDVVYDGGTLEHVFDFATGLENALRLVRVGGWFVSHTIANGFMGHGFYQFSPELFFRALGEPSGFSNPVVVAQTTPTSNLGLGRGGDWLVVTDPDELRSRVLYAGTKPLSLFVAARKNNHLSRPFAATPQQSDYQAAWESAPSNNETAGRIAALAANRRYGPVISSVVGLRHRLGERGTKNTKSYTSVDAAGLEAKVRQAAELGSRS